MAKQHWVKRPTFKPTFGPFVSAHATASSKTAVMIQTPTRTPSSDKISRILPLKLVVTKCRAKTKASFQYQ